MRPKSGLIKSLKSQQESLMFFPISFSQLFSFCILSKAGKASECNRNISFHAVLYFVIVVDIRRTESELLRRTKNLKRKSGSDFHSSVYCVT